MSLNAETIRCELETEAEMEILNIIKRMFRFDEPDSKYELLEREPGKPEHWGGWNDIMEQGSKDERIISSSLDDNEKEIRLAFRSDINKDVVFRRFTIAGTVPAMLVYMNGMAKDDKINDFILRPLMQAQIDTDKIEISSEYLINNHILMSEASVKKELSAASLAIMNGQTAVFIDGIAESIILDTRGYEKREVSTTENEKVVRGPKEGFNENLRTNITLVRRIIRSNDLVVEMRLSGGDNNLQVALLYRDDVTDRTLVEEVKRRLSKINTRTVMSTGIVEQLIENDSWSPLPQTLSTERPDRVASYIMQGGLAVLSEGSPFALIMPITISALMHSPEDIYMRKPLGTLLRCVRYLGVILSLITPGYFIALALYHQGLLSTEVLSTVIKTRMMVFEPLWFEMLILLFVFQLIREAGMRVPGSIGQAIGIIGGLILGQAAVAANLASSVILIVVAISGLGNFCIPDYSSQIAASYFRIAFVIAAWLGGLLGLVSAFMIFICYLANLKSFGVPFLTPFAPKTYNKRPFVLRGSIGMHQRGEDYINANDDTLKKSRERK